MLRNPDLSDNHITFTYASDIWIVNKSGGLAKRITSTPAVENDPYFSPNGKWLAFTSNRTGVNNVYIVPISGGTPTQLTWHPPVPQSEDGVLMGNHYLYQAGEIQLHAHTTSCILYISMEVFQS